MITKCPTTAWRSNYEVVWFFLIRIRLDYNYTHFIQIALGTQKLIVHKVFFLLRTGYCFISDVEYIRRHFEII